MCPIGPPASVRANEQVTTGRERRIIALGAHLLFFAPFALRPAHSRTRIGGLIYTLRMSARAASSEAGLGQKKPSSHSLGLLIGPAGSQPSTFTRFASCAFPTIMN